MDLSVIIIQAVSYLLLFTGASTACTSSPNSTENDGTVFHNAQAPEDIFTTDRKTTSAGSRIRGMRDKRNADLVIGGLFAVHSDMNGANCGPIRAQGGVDRVEAMLFALDSINSSPDLLPNITLGYDIRDTCFVQQIGLDEAADLILTGTQADVETQCATLFDNSNFNATLASYQSPDTIGNIGAASSPVSISIASLSRLFSIPQISYSSTSALLGNRERYSYFYRTVPSDDMEGRGIIDLLKHFNWTFISTIFSRNSYGQSGIDDLHTFAARSGICVDLNEGIEESFTEADYGKLVDKLLQSTANVVVLYATQQHAQGLFDQLAQIAQPKAFTWIATSAWAQLVESSSKPLEPSLVAGMFGFVPAFEPVRAFQDYYTELTPELNPRNPWFPEYFQSVLNSTTTSRANATLLLRAMQQNYAVPLVIDAVYTYAHAAQNYLSENCALPLVWNRTSQTCVGEKQPLNLSNLLRYIANVNFTSPTGNKIVFNAEGSVTGTYNIINYQEISNQNCNDDNAKTYRLRTIGLWDGSVNRSQALQINASAALQFGVNTTTGEIRLEPVSSECNTCSAGEYLRPVQGSCCSFCDPCQGPLFSNTTRASSCRNCSLLGERWGDKPSVGSTSCVDIPTVFLQFDHPFSIIISIGSGTGLLLLGIAAVIIAIYRKSPVIMASSRESVVLVMIGAGCSFVSSFIYLSPPSLTICILQRIMIWFSFSLMYSALLIKVTRIARIFVFQKSSLKKLACVQTHHQVIFSLLLVAVQMIIVTLSMVIVNPRVIRELRLDGQDSNALPQIEVFCQAEPLLGLLVSVLYEAGLILVTVVLGTLTFKSPANFNESKSTCVSAYILLIIWTMFFVSYTFTLESQRYIQNAFIALTNTLGAGTILGSVIGPRIFIVLFWKERDSKMYSRRATEGDVCASGDNLSTNSGGITLESVVDSVTPPTFTLTIPGQHPGAEQTK